MQRMTATDASRGFSDLLGRVASGEEVEITRAGAAVAVVGPPRVRLVSAARFAELLAAAPTVDAAFVEDVRSIRREAGSSVGDPWES